MGEELTREGILVFDADRAAFQNLETDLKEITKNTNYGTMNHRSYKKLSHNTAKRLLKRHKILTPTMVDALVEALHAPPDQIFIYQTMLLGRRANTPRQPTHRDQTAGPFELYILCMNAHGTALETCVYKKSHVDTTFKKAEAERWENEHQDEKIVVNTPLALMDAHCVHYGNETGDKEEPLRFFVDFSVTGGEDDGSDKRISLLECLPKATRKRKTL
jgi:hypothetical protein